VTGIWRKYKILYGFSSSKNDWYISVIDRIDGEKELELREPDEQMALQIVKRLKRDFETDIMKRKDIPS